MTDKRDGGLGCWQRFKNFFALTKPEATPLEWSTVIVILYGLFGSCYTITFIFPFLPEMVLFFGYKEEDKGYYAGLVASCIFLGRFFSSYFWGWLSDTRGRRSVMIVSLAAMAIVNIAFGFVTDLTSAMILRLIAGATNGLVGVTKSILCDISDDTNQAAGMSTIALAWGMGIVMGPFISGFTSNPAKKYSQFFSADGVFGRYPYLLASIIASVMCLGPFIVNILLLPETRHRKRRLVLISEVKQDVIETNREELVQMLPKGPSQIEDVEGATQNSNETVTLNQKLDAIQTSSEELVDMLPKGPSHNEDVEGTTQHSNETVTSNPQTIQVKGASESEPDMSEMDNKTSSEKHVQISVEGTDIPKMRTKPGCWDYMKDSNIYKMMKIPGVCSCMGLYSLLSFCVIGADEVFTVWASTDIHLHGLEFGTEELGMALGISSLPLLLIQVYLFPAAESRFGSKRTFEFSCLFLIFLGTTVGAMRILLPQPTMLWVYLLLYMGISRICTVTCFSAISIFMNNSVPPEYVGSLNGIAMTFGALFRGLAPTVGGSMFAWSITSGVKIGFPFDVNLVYIMFGSVFLASNILCSMMPKRLNRQSTAGHSKTH